VRKAKRIIFFFWLVFLGKGVGSGYSAEQKYIPDPDPVVRQRIEQWRDLKFGLLMHWGPYSQWGIVESWSICSEDEPWCRRPYDDYERYKREYEKLKLTFNPVKFAPEKWARAAKEAGMKYVVFTTKHHDGFCMFDTRYTDYKITAPDCPFSKHPRADVTREIFNAFRNEGFWIGAYFSKPDWHSDYYWWRRFATPDRNVNYDIEKYPDRWEKFVQFTHNQILELVQNYGPLDILWLDGGWVRKLTDREIQAMMNQPQFRFRRVQSQDIRIGELVRKVRAIKPDLIVVDRAVPGPYQNYLTPENRVPEKMLPYPWESCITSTGSWSYRPGATYKPARELIHLLVDIVAKGGNLLLNIAPGPDGTWDPDAYDRLRKVGAWMRINGEAIYGTRPVAPYVEGKVRLTRGKDSSVYLIYLGDEKEHQPPSEIYISRYQPPKQARATLLGTSVELFWRPVGSSGVAVKIPDEIRQHPPCDYAWTVRFSVP